MPKQEVPVVKKDTSPTVPQRDKIKGNLIIKEFPWTERQKEVISTILDKKSQIIFIEAPAGASKTLISVYCGLKLMSQKRISDIVYVRSIRESSDAHLGALPGEISNKVEVYGQPLIEKLHELLNHQDIKALLKEERVGVVPTNYLRGISWNAKFIIGDEQQNSTFKEIVTTMTRVGKFSKMVLCGDSAQSDLNGKSGGFEKIIKIFDNQESRDQGIFCIKLTSADIMRSGIVKYIVEKLETYRVEPMFPPSST